MLFEKDIDRVLCFLGFGVAASLFVRRPVLRGLMMGLMRGSGEGVKGRVDGVFDVVVGRVVVEGILDPFLDGRFSELAHEDVPVVEVRIATTVRVLCIADDLL